MGPVVLLASAVRRLVRLLCSGCSRMRFASAASSAARRSTLFAAASSAASVSSPPAFTRMSGFLAHTPHVIPHTTDDSNTHGGGQQELDRVGMVMAARAGDLWEAPHGGEWARNAKREQEQHRKSRAWRQGQQGCPACCSRQRGWGWKTGKEGTREWRGPRGERVTEERIATSHHIMCGECEAVQEAHNIRAEEEAEGQPIAKLAAAVRDVGPVLAHTGTKGRRKGGTHGGGGNRGGQWRNTRNAR